MNEAAPAEARRRRRPRTPPGIPHSAIETVMAGLHHVDGTGAGALRARIHNLRRSDFPDGVAAGSGRHFAYAAADVVGIALALELGEAFVPPATAAAIIRSAWPEFMGSFLAGWQEASSAVVIILPTAIAAIAEPSASLFHVETAALANSTPSAREIRVDAGALAMRLKREFSGLDARTDELLRTGLADQGSRFGRGAALGPGAGDPARLGGDGPYWARAIGLLALLEAGPSGRDERRARWSLDYLLKPAPVDGWKTRVQAAPDVGFAAALAWASANAGLRPARTSLPAERLERVGRDLREDVGGVDAVLERLRQIALRAPSAAVPQEAESAN